MINKISFENYKAFDSGEIKIKPITILLGANSVGKSSIMQLFLMLQQTALTENNYKSALKLHGGFVSMGEGLNLLRKKDKSKILSISIDYYNSNIKNEFDVFFSSFCQETLYYSSIVKKLSKDSEITQKDNNIFKKIWNIFKTDDDFDIRFLRMDSDKIEEILDKNTFYELIEETSKRLENQNLEKYPKELRDDYFYFRHSHRRFSFPTNHIKNLSERKDEYLLTYDFLSGLKNSLKNAHFTVKYEIVAVEKNIVVKKMGIFNENIEILSAEFDTHPSSKHKLNSITSDFISKERISSKTFKSLQGVFENPRTIFSFTNPRNDFEREKDSNSIFSNIVQSIFQIVNHQTSDYFENDNINYVSPLRAHPKRYYFLDKAKINAYVDTLDGDAIAETLKENSYLRNQVNSWLEKFNLKVEVSQLQDIIHKLVVNQNSLNLDITDVGFGISQVLPVIIQGFLSHKDSLTLIEQPEIHLHPKMQADLADLFIDIVITKNHKNEQKASKYLLIETHSEYLLKRLRRRISEGTISPENVAIYLINPQKNEEGGVITELKIEGKGKFEWPMDFYGGELLLDTTEFLKNQVNEQ